MSIGSLIILIEIKQAYKEKSIWITVHNKKKLFLFACDISEFAFHVKTTRALRCIFMAATWITVTQEVVGN